MAKQQLSYMFQNIYAREKEKKTRRDIIERVNFVGK